MKFFKATLVLCLVISVNAYSQDVRDSLSTNKGKNDTIAVAMTNIDGVLTPYLSMREVYVIGPRIRRSPERQAKFNRLRYNVLKVLPYAIFARDRYNQLQNDLAITGDKKEQRKLVKICEKEIKDMFNKEIKNMTITQGEILIKLIDRETGNSSYDMVRQLKGGVTAFSYQLVARVFGHDLKEKYDPQEQRDIEAIIQTTGKIYN